MSTPENSNTKGCLPAPYYNPGDSLEDVIDRLPLPYEVIDHADEVPGSQLPGYSPIFRNRLSKNGLINSFHPQVTTCYDIFRTTVVSYPKLGFLGFRELDPTTGTYSTNYKYISYEKGYQIVKELGAGIKYLLNEYYCPSEKTKDAIISIYLPNCYQFPLIDLATQSQSIVNTCLYDTLGESALVYILELTETPIIFTDKSKLPLFFKLKQNHLRNLQQNQGKAKLNFLKIIITNETLDLSTNHELFEEAHKANIFLIDLRTVQNIGRQNPAREVLPTRKTLFTISFTSGTTGVPKGAVLTHANAVSSIVAGLSFAGTARGIPLHKRHMFALLPLAHIYERSILYSTIFVATTVCFPHKPTEPATFFDDIKLVRPVDLVGVPRVLNRVEAGLKAKLSQSPYISGIINKKIEAMKKGETYSHLLFDYIIGPKIKAAIGFENLQLIVNGSAPISSDSLYYLQAVLGAPVVTGYGSTESFAAITTSAKYGRHLGSCGVIGPTVEMKLRDIPEMDYTFAKNRSGELLIRGESMTHSYFKQPDLYKESVDDEGWFHTGDVAKLNNENQIYITDRVKNFFKLSQGKYVAAERIQNIYHSSCLLFDQFYVYGDGLRSFLVGIIGLNVESLQDFIQKYQLRFDVKGLSKAVVENDQQKIQEYTNELNKQPLKKKILNEIDSSVAKTDLFSFEKIKNAYFAITPFSVQNDTLTPTLKIKRHQANVQYAAKIEELYNEGNLVSSAKI